jgi:hypothetical protein
VLVLAGCGGGRLSHNALVGRAGAICSAYLAQSGEPVPRPRSYAQVVAFANRTLPLYTAALRKLEALRPSHGDEASFNSWLAADRRAAAALRDLGLAGMRHDFPGTSAAVGRLQQAALASRGAAEDLGVTACAAG